MNIPLRSLALALVVAMSGCSPHGGFDRIAPFTLTFLDGGLGLANIRFEYDRQSRGCQSLDADLSIKVNDVRATDIFNGGIVRAFPFGDTSECLVPSVTVSRPVLFDQKATITATSGADTLLMEVEDVGATLSAQPILGTGEQVHAGQLVHLALGPGFDRIQWRASVIAIVHDGPTLIDSAEIPITGPSAAGVLDVQLPGDLSSGPTHLTIDVTSHPRVTRCEGPDACSAGLSMMVDSGVDMDVVP